jgi:hypothetical protein
MSGKSFDGSIIEATEGSITFRTCDTPLNPVAENRRTKKLDSLIKFKKGEEPESVFQSSFPNQFEVMTGSFLNIAQIVYNQHHKLVIRPEHIWACIQVQFSIYVNKYPEELRSKFVSHEAKEELEVTDGEAMSKSVGDMSVVMVNKMKAFLNDERLVDWMLPGFSTSTDHDKIVFSVIAMGSMQNYFSYKMCFECALPEVMLLGAVEDWKLIKTRIDKLLEFDFEFEEKEQERKKKLSDLFSFSKAKEKKVQNRFYMRKWRDMLIPVLDKFIETAEGKPDYYWWNQIAQSTGGGSGPTYFCGWAGVFNVFDEKGNWMGDQKQSEYHSKDQEWPVIDTNYIAPSYVSCPVKIDNNGDEFEARMYAGTMCANVLEETTVAPRLDWIMYRMK